MNLLRITCLFSLALSIMPYAHTQRSVHLLEGKRMYSKNTLISVRGMDFYNEGEFIQDSSTLLFTASNKPFDLKIGGNGTFSLARMEIDLGRNTLIMENDLSVAQEVVLIQGNLHLNSHKLSLERGRARIVGEGEGKRIIGEGVIEKESLFSPSQELQLGNLGLNLEVEENLGNSFIRRIQQTSFSDTLELIHRQYEIETSFIPQSPIQVSLTYLDRENPFGEGTMLIPLEQSDKTWNRIAYFQSKKQTNTMNLSLLGAKKSWHIGLSDATIQETFAEEKIGEGFELYPNPFDSFLFLQWEETGEIPVKVQLVSASGVLVYEKKLTFTSQEILLTDIPEMANGMYVVKVITDKGNAASRSLVHRQ